MSNVDPEKHIQVYEPAADELERLRGRDAVPAWPSPVEMVEAQPAPDLLTYWRVIRKRRWTILSILFVIFALTLIGTLKQTPVFRARALLEIQKENPEIASVQQLFELDSVSDAYLETQYKVLGSESLARRVVEQLRLENVEEFNPPPPWWASESKTQAPRAAQQTWGVGARPAIDLATAQRVRETFQRRLSVDPVKRSRLVSISFESADPELAARVVNALSANYIEQSLEARWDATQKASEWITNQLLDLKVRVEKSEQELQNYARVNGLLFLESERGNPENIVNQRLRQLQEELTRAQAIRMEKESLYRLVQAGDFASLPGIFENKLMQDLTIRQAEVRREHAQMLTTFSEDYPGVQKLQNQIDEIEKVLETERERAARRITNDYQAAVRREQLVQDAFTRQQSQADRIAELSVQYNILQREVETNKQMYEGLLQRLKEASVSAGLKASNIRIVDPAEPPRKPVKPRVLLNLALAFVLGAALGVGGAFLQEYLDNTLKTSEQVERLLRVPALAVIPAVESLNGRGSRVYGLLRGKEQKSATSGNGKLATAATPAWHRIDVLGQEPPALAEAFRGLRTSVLLSTPDHPPGTILVTSAQPSEGKTTVSSNLAISLAQLGHRVLLVEGDMRRPSLHRLFRLPNDAGLVNYLTRSQDWQSAVKPSSQASLDVLVCGPIPPNPAELLSSQRMGTLLREAASLYQFVVVDSPPLLSVADSRILATQVEGVVLVVKGGSTPRDLVQRAHAYVRNVGANIIGFVLNDVDVRADDYYSYQNYEYGDSSRPPGSD